MIKSELECGIAEKKKSHVIWSRNLPKLFIFSYTVVYEIYESRKVDVLLSL